MNSPVFSFRFLALLAFIFVVYFVVVGIRRRARLSRIGGGVVAAARTVFSAPAFLVPTLMGGAALFGLALAFQTGGQNPFLVDDEEVALHFASIALVGLCLAGHIGLLEARREGRAPESEDFLEGVRRHAWTILVAKVVWCLAILIPYEARLKYLDGYLVVPSDFESVWFYVNFLVPSLLLAPVLTTATHFPRRPFRALVASVAFTVRHPVSVARILALQFGVVIIGCAILKAGYATISFALTNASPLGFQLFQYIPVAHGDDGADIAATLWMGLTAPVFLTAYWSLSNGDASAAPIVASLGQQKRDVGRA